MIDWTFDGTWPHQPNWFRADEGLIHYVDEGPRDGRPVVLVHGNPTWGYLYRAFIAPLVESGHRVIVPDHLGFGRSEKPSTTHPYEVAAHARRFEQLIESLDLHGAVVVPHDWGGPISLRWAGRHPERVDGLFILNTLAHPVGPATLPEGHDGLSIPFPLHLIRSPGLGEVLVKGFDAFKPIMFRLAIENREALTAANRRAYRRVHSGWSERTGMLAFARQLPAGTGGAVNEMNDATEKLLANHFRSKPTEIVWGVKDLVLPHGMVESAWLRTLPDARFTLVPEAGHFIQEDAPDFVVGRLIRFLDSL